MNWQQQTVEESIFRMMDPLVSLAINMHANKGLYALLLGSGISRPAGIPTGWEVVLDLIRKVAAAEGDSPGDSPDGWYRHRFREEPDYSKILEKLSAHPTERASLLRSYFQPSEVERENGEKQPTVAHRRIAQLVAAGYVRLILTTNFDRLLESALEQVGVSPTVISTPDQFEGSPPFHHNTCTVVKVHGDYLDTRIRNTTSELTSYDPATDRALDRIFLEYGLVICAWSADWDHALRAAIERSPRYQFGCYWTDRGGISQKASALVTFRRATIIPIDSADVFFEELTEKLDALSDLASSHPMSAPILTATVKRYLAEDKYSIRLHDLIAAQVEDLRSTLVSDEFCLADAPTEEALLRRLKRYRALSAGLLEAFASGCYWGNQRHHRLWNRSLVRLVRYPSINVSFHPEFVGMRLYPALMVFYACGLGATAAGKWDTLQSLFQTTFGERGNDESRLIATLHVNRVNENRWSEQLPVEQGKTGSISMILFDDLRNSLRSLIADEQDYEAIFDRFEILLCMSTILNREQAARGRFFWKSHHGKIDVISPTLGFNGTAPDDSWPPLAGGLFNGDAKRAAEAVLELRQVLRRDPF